MTTPARRPRVPDPARWLLVAYGAVLALLLLAPSAAAPSWLVTTGSRLALKAGLPSAVAAPEPVEVLLNVAAFVPVSLLGSLLRPSLTWRDWTAIGFVASLLVEVVQAVVLDARSATHSDVVANTLGALLGALAGAVAVRRLEARSAEQN